MNADDITIPTLTLPVRYIAYLNAEEWTGQKCLLHMLSVTCVETFLHR